jgi:hypothetical protein
MKCYEIPIKCYHVSTLVSLSPLSLNYGEGEDATPSHFGIRSGPQISKLLI